MTYDMTQPQVRHFDDLHQSAEHHLLAAPVKLLRRARRKQLRNERRDLRGECTMTLDVALNAVDGSATALQLQGLVQLLCRCATPSSPCCGPTPDRARSR